MSEQQWSFIEPNREVSRRYMAEPEFPGGEAPIDALVSINVINRSPKSRRGEVIFLKPYAISETLKLASVYDQSDDG